MKYANEMVYYHRDYFDLSAIFYEKLSVVSSLIGWLKRRAGEALHS